MPYEFKDLTKDVAKGTAELKSNLAKLLVSTRKEDREQQKLTKTNEKALKIFLKYQKAIKAVSKDFRALTKDVDGAGKKLAVLGKSQNLQSIVRLADKVEDLRASVAGLSKAKAVVKVSIKGDKDIEKFKKSIALLSKSAVTMAAGVGAAGDTGKASKGSKELNKSIGDTAEAMDELEDTAESAQKAMGRFAKVLEPIKAKFAEGRKEAEDFAGGVGVSNGVMIGAGIAAVYLANKLSDLISEYTDARMELGKYRIGTTLAEEATIGFTKGGLEKLRKQLSLTRAQASEYFKVVREGTNVLGMSPAKIAAVSKALQDTFGGDPTDRLREYVGLLKEIPTLDTDLKVSATMDDETAAIFALAQSGKMEVAIDFQAAGLLGAGKKIEMTADDAAIIQAQQKTQSAVEGVNDMLKDYYPKWGPQFTAMVGYMSKTVAALGGAVAIMGAASVFMGKKLADGNRTRTLIKSDTARIAATVAMGGGRGTPPPIPKGGAGGAGGGGILARITNAVKGLGTKASQAAGQAGKWAKGLGLATKITAGVGIVLAVAGIAADKLADHFEESGDMMSASTSRVTGELAKFAGVIVTATAIGALFGGVGAPIGALIGTIIALFTQLDGLGKAFESYGSQLQKTVKILGKEVPRFNATVRSLGELLEGFGVNLQDTGITLKKFGKEAWEITKTTLLWTTDIGRAILAFRALKDAMASDEYKAAMADATAKAKALSGEQENLKKSSKVFAEGMVEDRKALMMSGLELQKQLAETENAFKSGKFALADFEAGISKLKLGNFSTMGSSARAFTSAIQTSTKAISNRFKFAGKALDEMREGIRKNSKLEGEQRRQALDDLYKKELEAVKQLVDGVKEVVDAMYKSPKIIQEGLRRETARTKLTGDVEANTAPAREILKVTGEMYDSAVENLKDVNSATTDATIAVYAAAEKVKEIQKKAGKDMVGLFEEMSAEEEKAFSMKGIIKKTEDGFEINKEKAGEFHDVVSKQLDDLTEQLDKTKKALPSDSFLGLAASLAKVEENAKIAGSAVEKAEQEKARAAKEKGGGLFTKGPSIKEATEEWKAAKENQAEALREQGEVTKQIEKYAQGIYDGNIWPEINKTVKQSGVDVESFKTAMIALGKATSEGREVEYRDLEGQVKDANKTLMVIRAISKAELKSHPLFEKIRKDLKKASKLVDLKDVSGRYIDEQNLQTTNLEVISEGEMKSLELQRQIGDIVGKFTDVLKSGEVWELERQIDALNLSADLAAKTGSPIEQTVKSIEKQGELFKKQYDVMSRAIDDLQVTVKKGEDAVAAEEKRLSFAKEEAKIADEVAKTRLRNAEDAAKKAKDTPGISRDKLASTEKELSLAREAVRAGDNISQLRIKGAERSVRNTKNTLGIAQGALRNAENKMNDILKTFPKLGEATNKALESFRDSFEGQKITAKLDLSDALGEFAEFSDDAYKYSAEATAIAIEGAKERAKAEKKAVMDALATEEKFQMERVRLSKGSPEEKARLAADVKASVEAKKRAELAKIETAQKKKVVEAAKAEADLKMGFIEASQTALDAEMEVASMRGRHLSTLLNLQKESLGIEAERVEVIRKEYLTTLANNGNTLETQIKAKQLRTAEFNLQKKSLGYQRDIMEKMLGTMLGELRTSVGGKRQRLTDVGLMGMEATRVKTGTGIYTSAGPGGVQPYWKRQVEREKGLGARRMSIEKKMEQQLRANEKNTRKTAEGVDNMDKRSGTSGSLFVHDVSVEGLLGQILAEAKNIASKLTSGLEANKAISNTDKQTQQVIKQQSDDIMSLKTGIVDIAGETANAQRKSTDDIMSLKTGIVDSAGETATAQKKSTDDIMALKTGIVDSVKESSETQKRATESAAYEESPGVREMKALEIKNLAAEMKATAKDTTKATKKNFELTGPIDKFRGPRPGGIQYKVRGLGAGRTVRTMRTGKTIEQTFENLDKSFGKSKGKTIEQTFGGLGGLGRTRGRGGRGAGGGAAMAGFDRMAAATVPATASMSASDAMRIAEESRAIIPKSEAAFVAKPSMGGVAAGEGGGETNTKVDVEITMKEPMFEAKVVNVVARRQGDPQIVKAQDKNGILRRGGA